MKTSAISVYLFFVGVLVFSVFFVLKPPAKKSKTQLHRGDVAMIEIRQFTLFLVENKRLEMIIRGEKAMRFNDYDQFEDFFIAHYPQDTMKIKKIGSADGAEYFYVNRGVKRGSIYEFYDGMDYRQEGGYSFNTNRGNYDSKNRLFVGEGPFELRNKDGVFTGSNLYYDARTKFVSADNPKGNMWLEN
ncbi:hypothetical protein BBW65_01115 [Helicobacter enhydrae]|uniref:LPS export ABC transporter periplasmic protein LptC n=1 Tax=Helicobacter enhydrae TaxID=222136 RepID=A0A1B1U3Z4_9HELI|nr:hypothetical protein [Helicobacter enhydrae]ANV97497.1 hypothetical protein BBW65_01115 [Helicobacter enhydrae]